MSGKNRWYACAALVLSLLVPGLAFAQDAPVPVPDLFQVTTVDESAPECADSSVLPAESVEDVEDKASILKELERTFGAQNVCGAPCGWGRPTCWSMCGDAATCRKGYCVYL